MNRLGVIEAVDFMRLSYGEAVTPSFFRD